MNGQSSLIALLCLAGAVLLWGTSFMAMKVALTCFDPMTVVFLRMALASALMALCWGRVPKAGRRKGDLPRLGLLCLLQPCLYFLLEGFAVRLTTSAQAGMVSSLVPLLVAAGAWAFLREPLTGRMAAGLALSLGGVAWLSAGAQAGGDAPNPVLGNTLELLAMFCASGYMLVLKRLADRYDTWLLTGLQTFAGAVFFLPCALLAEPGWLAAPLLRAAGASWQAWTAVAYLGGMVTLGGFGLYNMAAARLPAAQAAMSINLVPLVALAAGGLVLGESLAAGQIAACGLILAGVVLGQTGGFSSRRRRA
jgi:drug/metabolite transporter (DMT)-like permease